MFEFSIAWRLYVVSSISGEVTEELAMGGVHGYPDLAINLTGALITYLENVNPMPWTHVVFETTDSGGNVVSIINKGMGRVVATFGNVLPDFEGMADDIDMGQEYPDEESCWQETGTTVDIDPDEIPF